MPTLPHTVTVAEVEGFLDRVAEEIVANQNGEALLPMFQWLETQLELKKQRQATMDAVLARVAKRRGG